MNHIKPFDKTILLLVMTIYLFVSGCASTSSGSPSSSALHMLDQWVVKDLATYLREKMVGHPRFISEPVAIVKLSDGDVTSQIDSLSNRIRRDLEDELLKQGGISLIWQRPSQAPDACASTDDANYFIGLETFEEAGEINVRVRILDVRDNSLVPQLALNYRGVSDKQVHGLLKEKVIDSTLKGSRRAPFSAKEVDLAAETLAKKLSCKVSKFSGSANIHLEVGANADQSLVSVTALLRNYVSQQENITLTAKEADAEFLLSEELQLVSSDLAQLWLKPKTKDSAPVPGAVHVYVDYPMLAPTGSKPTGPTEPTEPTEPPAAKTVIGDFNIFAPRNLGLCKGTDPWAQGQASMADEAELPSGSCFSINYTLLDDGYVYLVHEGPDGTLTRLLPDNCHLSQSSQPTLARDLWYPSINKGQRQMIFLDDEQGTEVFHLLAVDNNKDSRSLLAALRGLPSPTSSCGTPKGISIQTLQKNQLQDRINATGAKVDWQTRRIIHR